MENEYKDMFKYLQENDLGVSSLNISLVKNRDLSDPNTLIEVKEIIDEPCPHTRDFSRELGHA